MKTETAPHMSLLNAAFVLAFSGEGASAYVVRGWEALLRRFAMETIDYTGEIVDDPRATNREEWEEWLSQFSDPDEWTADEEGVPFHFQSEVGEISSVSIYRLAGPNSADEGDARLSNAAHAILAERRRQIDAEGWTAEHDDEHVNDEIAALACFYAMPPGAREWPATETGYGPTLGQAIVPEGWTPKEGDRRQELVKAGALILAEIERIDRADAGSPMLKRADPATVV